MCKALIIDFDGGISNIVPQYLGAAALAFFKEQVNPEEFLEIIAHKPDLASIIQLLVLEYDAQALADRRELFRQLLITPYNLQELSLNNSIFEFFEYLHTRGTPIVVLSSMDTLVVQRGLASLGVSDFITGIVADEGQGSPRTDYKLSRKLIKRITGQLKMEDVLMIASSEVDIVLGRKLGCVIAHIAQDNCYLGQPKTQPDFLTSEATTLIKVVDRMEPQTSAH